MAEVPQDPPPGMDMGTRLRTWRVFLSWVRWSAVAAIVLLAMLLLFCAPR